MTFTIGLPALAMMNESPAAACSMSSASWMLMVRISAFVD
jgi:hypothetical protein